MKEFIVYMHENKINHKKYIGITCQKPTQRWRGGKGYKIGNKVIRHSMVVVAN